MADPEEFKSALSVNSGIHQPPSINPDAINHLSKRRKKKYSADQYVKAILEGDRTILSQAITLVESNNSGDADLAQDIVEQCLPFSAKSIRIGITGSPGAGKSTFIETFGKLVTDEGRKLAVLAIDPSSEQTKGSILGDKTRMERLGNDPRAFIRPTPSSGTLGGVAKRTRETIILFEAAGFDTALVETVGVGQSETTASSMVDFFLLLQLAGAGDELQGIKRGIMEMADTIAITKADGNNLISAERAKIEFQNALHLYPPKPSGWRPNVISSSSFENRGIREIWESIKSYIDLTKKSGYFEEKRKQQAIIRMHDAIIEQLKEFFYNSGEIKKMKPEIEKQLREGSITSYKAARSMLNKYFKK
jgi:LAO/AO transport system kinase